MKLSKLRILNSVAAVLHGVQAIAILLLSVSFTLPISGGYLAFDTTLQTLVPQTKLLFDVSLPALVAAFFILSSLAHLTVATFLHRRYERDIKKGLNVARWIEYSASASVMMVAISLLVGIYDLSSLLMIFFLTALMNLMGLVMEVHNQTTKKTNWLSYIIGCIAGIVPWLVVALYLWFGAEYGSKAPDFVYWIFVSIFVFFNTFAINMVLQYKKVGPWKDYLYGEYVYIVLSLVAKTLLAWQVFAGTLQP